MPAREILAVGTPEFSLLLILLFVIVVPIAGVAFARSGKGYSEIGKGRFAVDFGEEGDAGHEEEVRQLVEAKAYRQERRGERPVDVEEEVERLLRRERAADQPAAFRDDTDPEDALIRAEIRAVVIARNESRKRRGEDPLDVEAEIERMLAEFD